MLCRVLEGLKVQHEALGVSEFRGEHLHPAEQIEAKPTYSFHVPIVVSNEYGEVVIKELYSEAKIVGLPGYLPASVQKRFSHDHLSNYICYHDFGWPIMQLAVVGK